MSLHAIQSIRQRTGIRRIHLAQIALSLLLASMLARIAPVLLKAANPASGSWSSLTAAQFFNFGFDYLFFAAGLVAFGFFLVCKADARVQDMSEDSLSDVLRCVEAAATGDLTRQPLNSATGELGQLSQAVGRLISVLARSESLVYNLSALVESSSDAIVSQTLDGTITNWNKGAQRIYGYGAEEVKGQSIAILSPGDQGAELKSQLQKLRIGERVPPFEAVHQARNGRTVKALVRISPILDSTRLLIGATFCAQDLTDAELHKSTSSPRETEHSDFASTTLPQ